MKKNPSQLRAIAHLSGPMMVLAGPGSGKTSVIVERTAYMTSEGKIPASSILVVTFSRAAAKEMKERFLKFTGQTSTAVTFGTFHGVFYGILKQAYGLGAGNILSEEEKYAILKEMTLEFGQELAQEGDFQEDVAKEISVVKGNRISLDHYYSSCCPDEVFRQIYNGYQKTLRQRRKLDFDDMLLCCYELFDQRKDILTAWQNKFQYIMVDEFQDINHLQYDIVRMLAKPRDNLFIVGDDDQSIYHFRGAKPEIMLNFTKNYPKAETVLLRFYIETFRRSSDLGFQITEPEPHHVEKGRRLHARRVNSVSLRANRHSERRKEGDNRLIAVFFDSDEIFVPADGMIISRRKLKVCNIPSPVARRDYFFPRSVVLL